MTEGDRTSRAQVGGAPGIAASVDRALTGPSPRGNRNRSPGRLSYRTFALALLLSTVVMLAPLDSWVALVAESLGLPLRGTSAGSLWFNDKTMHFLGFGVLTWIGARTSAFARTQGFARLRGSGAAAPSSPSWSGLRWCLLVALLTGYGALIEALQSFVPWRSAEWADLLADCLGSLLVAAMLFTAERRTRQEVEPMAPHR